MKVGTVIFTIIIMAVALVAMMVLMGKGNTDVVERTPAQTLTQSVARPEQTDYQALLCVTTSGAVVYDRLDLPLRAYGTVQVQWADGNNRTRAVFSPATSTKRYCTLVVSSRDFPAPIRRVQLDLTDDHSWITDVELCAWTSASSPVKDAEGRLHAPCTQIKPYAPGLYGITMIQADNELFNNFTPILVGQREANSPTLIP